MVIYEGNIIVDYQCDRCGNKAKDSVFPNDWHAFTIIVGGDEFTLIACSPICYLRLCEMKLDDVKFREFAQVDSMSYEFAYRFFNSVKHK